MTMMMTSTATRRLALASASTTTKAVTKRVYLTHSRPPPGAPQHVRGYRSSLQNPYFAPSPAVVVESAGAGSSDSFWQQAFRWYSEKLTTHPLTTKSLTGAIIAAAGDVLCQAGTFKETKDKPTFFKGGWDMRRSFHFFIIGLTFVAPTSHYWYGGMAVHPWTKGRTFGQISKRVALDQFVWSPVFFVIWLASFWGLEKNGKITASEMKNDLAVALPDVLVANWILWIPCQYLNFYAVPTKFQVLFTNIVELAWNAYLSFATEGGGHGHGNKQIEEEKEEEAVEEQADTVQQLELR